MFGFTSLLRKHITPDTLTRYAGAIAFAVFTALGLIAFYVAMALVSIASTNVHLAGTGFVLAFAGLCAWMIHAEWND